MGTAVLFCADPLRPRSPDAHFAREAEAVAAFDGTVALVDHDALLRGDAAAAVRRVPEGLGPAWYRGWMIPSARYAQLEEALHGRGAALVVTAEEYRRAHEFPGWYEIFVDVTPASVWLPTRPGVPPTPAALAAATAAIGGGPGIVKDYVKSRKHEWDEACYIPNLFDVAALHAVVSTFVERQEEDLAGGVVLRRFEPYLRRPGHADEIRVWWFDGAPMLVTAHPDAPGEVGAPDLTRIAPPVARLGCQLVTTDLALRADGRWRVVEVGDGQVSDLPRETDPSLLLERLVRSDDPIA
ncbi:ATP-grasp domain-containing protein [Virgisporangium aliadipatigenens]|uniref:ATP-grasp domain-containing protein n=1 Tax=Virgisporangium aliadipatigenens TaxID=741659 RepID=UPI001944CABF|nr:ATP-grasp domain-containing protein [Virgisporangium aliadipatigenens]